MSLIDEPRAWFVDTEGQKLLTRPTNDASNPLNVVVVNAAVSAFIDEYNEINSVAQGVLSTIVSYTVPVAKTLSLEKVEVSGENIAIFEVLINSITKGKRRTYWGKFNSDFEFKGFTVAAGLTVEVKVIHTRTVAASFNANLLGSLA